MKLEEIIPKLPEIYQKKFLELKLEEDISGFTINKGNTGQFLQKLLNMPLNCDLTDFEDGELKTNKSRPDGVPDQTMFITQISKDFDSLFFSDSGSNRLLKKIDNLIYLPVVKTHSKDPNEWYFLPAYHVNSNIYEELKDIYLKDFLIIKEIILNQLETADKMVHTANGDYIQIRSKDSKDKNGNYHPIFSDKLNRYVSNKNHAFYFKRDFMIDIRNGTLPSKKIV